MNSTSQYELTIVVPVYNEQENMERLEQELGRYISVSSMRSCVLFVDDGSRDRSGEYIKTICSRCDHFYYISLAKNSGLSAAIKAGIDVTESPYIGYIDADLQTSPEDFELLIPYARDWDFPRHFTATYPLKKAALSCSDSNIYVLLIVS